MHRKAADRFVLRRRKWDVATKEFKALLVDLNRIQEIAKLLFDVAADEKHRTQLNNDEAALVIAASAEKEVKIKKACEDAHDVVKIYSSQAKFDQARKAPKLIPDWETELEKASDDLKRSAGKDADLNRKIQTDAESLKNLIEKYKLLQKPLDVDFTEKTATFPNKWMSGKEKDWLVVPGRWIQSAKAQATTPGMKSFDTPWPENFDLELDFAMISSDKEEIDNNLWTNTKISDLLRIAVADHNATIAEMRFGTLLGLGGNRFAVKFEDGPQQQLQQPQKGQIIRLKLQRQGNSISVDVSGRSFTLPATRPCSELTIDVKTRSRGQPGSDCGGYPAIFRISVRPKNE